MLIAGGISVIFAMSLNINIVENPQSRSVYDYRDQKPFNRFIFLLCE